VRVIVNFPFALSTITRLPASIRSFSDRAPVRAEIFQRQLEARGWTGDA
jgi:hypothetical protein